MRLIANLEEFNDRPYQGGEIHTGSGIGSKMTCVYRFRITMHFAFIKKIESLTLLRLVSLAIEGETKGRVKHCAKSESGTRAYFILCPWLADDVGEFWSLNVNEKGQ